MRFGSRKGSTLKKEGFFLNSSFPASPLGSFNTSQIDEGIRNWQPSDVEKKLYGCKEIPPEWPVYLARFHPQSENRSGNYEPL